MAVFFSTSNNLSKKWWSLFFDSRPLIIKSFIMFYYKTKWIVSEWPVTVASLWPGVALTGHSKRPLCNNNQSVQSASSYDTPVRCDGFERNCDFGFVENVSEFRVHVMTNWGKNNLCCFYIFVQCMSSYSVPHVYEIISDSRIHPVIQKLCNNFVVQTQL